MLQVTEHTRLLNKFIGLCTNTGGWPRMLYDIGFRVQFIEQRIAVEGGSITPDVVGVSDPLSHALVVDCKGGRSIDRSQDARYEGIKREDLAGAAAVRERGRLTHTACYAANEANYGELRGHTKLPFIVFGKDSVRGAGSFGQPKLDKALGKKTSLAGCREPRYLYPFSPDDPPQVALRYIIEGIVSCAANAWSEDLDFTAEDGMRDAIKAIHPFYESMGARHAGLLVRKAATWFGEMLDENADLKELYKKVVQEGFDITAAQLFGERCREELARKERQSSMADTLQ